MGLGAGGLQSGGGTATTLAPGATGSTLVLSGNSTALKFISTAGAGADGFAVTTNGAQWHVGTGASDFFTSDGTTITFAGPISTAAATVASLISTASIRSANSQFYGSATGVPLDLVGFITAAAAGTTTPAIRLYPLNALDATDLVFQVATVGAAANLLSVDYTGKLTLADQVVLSSYTDDSATPGARTVNKVRGKNAIAAGASSCVITNSFVTANSQILCTLEANDATATFIKSVAPGAGSFTITVNANATAALKFAWTVIN